MASLLSSREACDVTDAFLYTLYGERTFSRWKELKHKKNFDTETDYVSWLLDIAEYYEQEDLNLASTTDGVDYYEQKPCDEGNQMPANPAIKYECDNNFPDVRQGKTRARRSDARIDRSGSKRIKSEHDPDASSLMEVQHPYDVESFAASRLMRTSANQCRSIDNMGSDTYAQSSEWPAEDISAAGPPDFDASAEASNVEEVTPSSEHSDGDNTNISDFHTEQHAAGFDDASYADPAGSSAISERDNIGEEDVNILALSQHKPRGPRAKDNGAKRHSCEFCMYAAASRADVDRHVRTVHQKIKDFQCPEPQCDYSSGYRGNLNKHMARMHATNDSALVPFTGV